MRRSLDITLIGIVCLVVSFVFYFGSVLAAELFDAAAAIGQLIGLAFSVFIFISICFILFGPLDFISILLQLLPLLGPWPELA